MTMTRLTLLVFIIYQFLTLYVSYLMLYNKLSQTAQLKTMHSFVSLFLWIMIPGIAQLGLQDFTHACNQDVSCPISSQAQGRVGYQAYGVVGKFQFLTDHRTKGLSFLLLVGQRPLSFPCHNNLSIQQLKARQFASIKPAHEMLAKPWYKLP